MTAILILGLAPIGVDASPTAPDATRLRSAADYSESKNGRTMVVMYDGRVIFESYHGGGTADGPQMLASGSKSFVGVAAMAAVEDGLLRLDDPACEAIVEWKDDPSKSRITYRQLLTLTSGLTPGERGAAVRAPSWKAIVAKPMVGTPGGQFAYGAYHLNAFADALERKLEGETFEAYLKRRVLDPLGVKVDWRFRCDDGHPQVGGGGFMTARDWATFGEFVRREGRHGDRVLIDAGRLAECFRGTDQNPAYGLTWWLKRPLSVELLRRSRIIASEWGGVANSRSIPDDL